MGMAASQARLLTITARLADNELRSQTINNAKMRLATQSAQASDDYVSALNNAQLMFTNNTMDGTSQTQALTFNSLTQYSPYNTQYGIVNSAGLIMVSEEDAKIFKSNSDNLEGFLKAHGLEYETTFFNDSVGGEKNDLQAKLTSFYKSGVDSDGNSKNNNLDKYFKGLSNDDLKKMYEKSLSQNASTEYLNYTTAAQKLYQESLGLYDKILPVLANEVFGSSDAEKKESEITDALWQKYRDAETNKVPNVINELLKGTDNPAGAPGNPANYAYDHIKASLNASGSTYVEEFAKSLVNVDLPDQTQTAAYAPDDSGFPSKVAPETKIYKQVPTEIKNDLGLPYNPARYNYEYEDKEPYKDERTYTVGNVEFHINPPQIDYWTEVDDSGNTVTTDKIKSVSKGQSYLTVTASGFYYDGQLYNAGDKINVSALDFPENPSDAQYNKYLSIIYTKDDDSYSFYRTQDGKTVDYEVETNDQGGVPTREDVYKEFIDAYLDLVSSTRWVIDPQKYAANSSTSDKNLAAYNEALKYFTDHYGADIVNKTLNATDSNDNYLTDLDKFVQKEDLSSYTELNPDGSYKTNSGFSSVLNSYLVDKMLDVLGEPKYAWVDKNDTTNTGNADSKAQWYTNLFNRMQKGYKVLENGLAQSKDWMEHAFESGLVTMEQVDASYNWNSLDYKSCSSITEQTDTSAAVAKAEAKYQRAMNDIQAKDSIYDIQLKNIDTEHTSLQTEYDSIKNAMNKNIERTMKFCQNG